MKSETPDARALGAPASSVDALRRVPSLAGLDRASLALIAETASFQRLGSGERLIRKGDAAQTLYLVLTGRFRVVNDGATIATIGPGEPIGELAFFAGAQRSADVLAMRDSTLLELDRQRYDRLVATVPGLASGILATVAARLAGLTARARALPPQAGRVVTLAGAGAGPLPQSLIDGLQSAAARHGGIMLHDGSAAPVDAGPAALGEWMRALVLAGGGAFGTAHPGACKALQQSGIAIDFPGGTSFGAVMAPAIARRLAMDEIMCPTNDDFVTDRAMDRLRIASGLVQSGV